MMPTPEQIADQYQNLREQLEDNRQQCQQIHDWISGVDPTTMTPEKFTGLQLNMMSGTATWTASLDSLITLVGMLEQGQRDLAADDRGDPDAQDVD